MSGTLILPPKAKSEPGSIIEAKRDMLRSVVPSSLIDPDLWYASLMIEANGLGGGYAVTPISAATAALNAAYLGLQFGKSLGHAYLLPFKNNSLSRDGKDVRDVQLVIGYRGHKHLAFQTGFLRSLHVNVCCRGEEWKHWVDETGPRLLHTPAEERNPDRSNITQAYVVYSTTSDGRGLAVVPRVAINKVDKNRDVWQSDFAAMCKKTAVLRAAKEWNTTARMAHAIRIDEESERDEPQSVADELRGALEDIGVETEQYTLPIE